MNEFSSVGPEKFSFNRITRFTIFVNIAPNGLKITQCNIENIKNGGRHIVRTRVVKRVKQLAKTFIRSCVVKLRNAKIAGRLILVYFGHYTLRNLSISSYLSIDR